MPQRFTGRAFLFCACLFGAFLTSSMVSADVRQIALPTSDLVYDSRTGKLYASVPSSAGAMGNSVAVIDPASGQVGPFTFVGSEPGKLALSDDGKCLYVGLDGAAAVRRFDLAQQKAGMQFSLGSSQYTGPYFVEDMEVAPGQPEVVAISRRNLGFSPPHEGVAIYDNSVPRAKTTPNHTGSDVIQFSASAGTLYGYSSIGDGGFRRLTVDATGVTERDVTPVALGSDFKFSDGLVYGSSGRIFNPESRQLVGSFSGITGSALVEPDPGSGRVFFLTGDGLSRKLLAFSRDTFVLVGSEDVTGVMGRATSLVRWGTDGLAFRTDQGQLFLIRTPLRTPGAFDAHLLLKGTVVPDPAIQDQEMRLVLTIDNQGPQTATGVRLIVTPPGHTDVIVSITPSQGSIQQVGGQIKNDIGSIAANGRATLTIVFKPGANSPGPITSWSYDAFVVADQPQTPREDTHLSKTIRVQPRPSSPPGSTPGAQIVQLPLLTKDLVYDRVTHRIYASVPGSAGSGGNSITAVDPVSGAIGSPVFVGSEPGKLALSDDGQFLYVSLDGAAAMRRFDMATQTPGLQFALGSDSFFGPYYVEDMEVVPGNPRAVAISRMNQGVSPRHAGVAIYDDGVPRGKVTERHTGSNVIEFSANPITLYGYNNETTEFGFRRMLVDSSGVTVQDVRENLISGFGVDIRFDAGRIYTTTGRVIDPEAGVLLGTFPGIGDGGLVAPDVKSGGVYYLSGDGPTRKLLIFDPQTFLQVGSIEIPGVMGRASRLIRWGQEPGAAGGGLAFGTDQGQLFLIRTPSPRAVDFTLTVQPTSVVGGARAVGTVTFTGAAPTGGVTVDFASSSPVATVVPASVSAGPGPVSGFTVAILTQPVTTPTDVVISAAYNGSTRTATLRVLPPAEKPHVVSLALDPAQVTGGAPVVGTVTLSGPAPAGGRGVGLGTDSPSVVGLPKQVVVSAGATQATFTIHTQPVPRTRLVSVWAAGGEVHYASLRVEPPTPPGTPSVASFSISQTQVTGGGSVVGTVTLTGPAPAGGRGVGLGTSDPAVILLPRQVVVPAGVTQVMFPINTRSVTKPSGGAIWATAGDVRPVQLRVIPPAGLWFDPATVQGGRTTRLTVVLPAPAPADGVRVNLASSNSKVASAPPPLRLIPGTSTISWQVQTHAVTSLTTIVFTATFGGQTWSAALTVVP